MGLSDPMCRVFGGTNTVVQGGITALWALELNCCLALCAIAIAAALHLIVRLSILIGQQLSSLGKMLQSRERQRRKIRVWPSGTGLALQGIC